MPLLLGVLQLQFSNSELRIHATVGRNSHINNNPAGLHILNRKNNIHNHSYQPPLYNQHPVNHYVRDHNSPPNHFYSSITNDHLLNHLYNDAVNNGDNYPHNNYDNLYRSVEHDHNSIYHGHRRDNDGNKRIHALVNHHNDHRYKLFYQLHDDGHGDQLQYHILDCADRNELCLFDYNDRHHRRHD